MVRRFEPGLRLVLWRAAGGDPDLIRDVSQETLLIVLQRLRAQPLEDPARLAAFAAQTARNLAFTDHRRRQRNGVNDGDELLPEIGDPAPRPIEKLGTNAAVSAVRELLPELRNTRDRELLPRGGCYAVYTRR